MTFQYPIREAFETPPEVRDVWIRREGAPALHGWLMGEAREVAVLHVHGNAGHVGFHAEMSAFLAAAGIGVLLFDYRGFGRSDRGRGDRHALLEDADRALDALLGMEGVDPGRVGVYGVSLGGVIGLALAATRREVRCVATVAAFATWRGVARDHAGVVGAALVRPGMDAVSSAARLGTRPLLIVRPRHADAIERSARGAGVPVERLDVARAGHNDVHLAAGEEITRFFRSALA